MLGSHKTTCARLGPDRTKPARNLHHDLHRNSDPQAQRTRYFYYASRYSLDNHPVAVPDLFAIIPDGTIPPNCSTHVTICAQHGAQSSRQTKPLVVGMVVGWFCKLSHNVNQAAQVSYFLFG